MKKFIDSLLTTLEIDSVKGAYLRYFFFPDMFDDVDRRDPDLQAHDIQYTRIWHQF